MSLVQLGPRRHGVARLAGSAAGLAGAALARGGDRWVAASMIPEAFRPDIQGLRAVAVLLVVAYHLWPDVVTGGFVGVDVFFVISGFLITSHLLQHPPGSARDLLEFWARRIRRILPAAFIVLAVTAVASRIVAPETRWASTAAEIIASAVYIENWVLAANSVDYLAAADPPTPVQHYWSLSVEEQFYLVWPILILAAFWFARQARLAPRPIVGLAMASVVGTSLVTAIVATAADPASAYFITQTRIWELALGGCVAAIPVLTCKRPLGRARDVAAWVGLALIIAAGLILTPATPFPGEAALLPVTGAALVILAAAEGSSSPTRLLRVRPIQHLGDTSYSIYLWHWPLIVLWPLALGAITPISAAAIIGLTVALATISKAAIEDRYRFAPSLQRLAPTFRLAVVGMVLVSMVGGAQLIEAQLRLDATVAATTDRGSGLDEAWSDEILAEADEGAEDGWATTPRPVSTATDSVGQAPAATASSTPLAPGSPPASGPTSCRGAAAIVHGFAVCPQDPGSRMVPGPLAARSDWSDAYRDGCWIYSPFSKLRTCRYGRGKIRIALVGNSHAGHWLPTLQVLAKRNRWSITTFLASRCNATDAALELYGGTDGCLQYGRWVMKQTRGKAFDLVITSERQSVKTRGDSTWSKTRQSALAGYRSYLKRWSASGARVLILRDTPFPGQTLGTVPDCLASHRDNQTRCAGTPDSWRWIDPLFDAATAVDLPGIRTLDTTRFLCTATTCPAVIGSVVAYFDGSHMTATYARSIAPFIEADIIAALESERSR